LQVAMVSRLLLLALVAFVGLGQAAQTSLDGEHFKITVIHSPPAIDVGLQDGSILASSEWKGYLIDMLRTISDLANFTYTLQLPSGAGSSCKANGTASDWAFQYGCGQEDVLNYNTSDAYWGTYYITQARLDAGTLFTAPFMTNVGVTLAVPGKGSQGFIDRLHASADFITAPISLELWGATVFTVFFIMISFWYLEQFQLPMKWAKKMTKAWRKDVNENEMELSLMRDQGVYGYLTLDSLWQQSSRTLAATLGTLTMHTNPSEAFNGNLSKPGLLLNALWCFVVLIWTSGYTANLAVILSSETDNTLITVLDLADARGTACVYGGAAYVGFIQSVYPTITLVPTTGGVAYLDLLYSGQCDAILDAAVQILTLQEGALDLDSSTGVEYCKYAPLKATANGVMNQGVTNMGGGVSPNQRAFRDVLSYWITALRTCNPKSDSDTICGTNTTTTSADELISKHLLTKRCGATTSAIAPADKSTAVDHQITPDTMLVPFLVIGFVAFMCLTIKAYQYWGYIGVHMKSLVGKTIGKKVQTGNIDEVLMSKRWIDVWDFLGDKPASFGQEPANSWWNCCTQFFANYSCCHYRYRGCPRVIHMQKVFDKVRNNEDNKQQVLKAVDKFLIWHDLELYFVFPRLIQKLKEIEEKKAQTSPREHRTENNTEQVQDDEWYAKALEMVIEMAFRGFYKMDTSVSVSHTSDVKDSKKSQPVDGFSVFDVVHNLQSGSPVNFSRHALASLSHAGGDWPQDHCTAPNEQDYELKESSELNNCSSPHSILKSV